MTDQADADVNGSGDACDAMPTTYTYDNAVFTGSDSSVSYTGQTARQVLIGDMAYYMDSVLVDDTATTAAEKETDMKFLKSTKPISFKVLTTGKRKNVEKRKKKKISVYRVLFRRYRRFRSFGTLY